MLAQLKQEMATNNEQITDKFNNHIAKIRNEIQESSSQMEKTINKKIEARESNKNIEI